MLEAGGVEAAGFADDIGAEHEAGGHHATIEQGNVEVRETLQRGVDVVATFAKDTGQKLNAKKMMCFGTEESLGVELG